MQAVLDLSVSISSRSDALLEYWSGTVGECTPLFPEALARKLARASTPEWDWLKELDRPGDRSSWKGFYSVRAVRELRLLLNLRRKGHPAERIRRVRACLGSLGI